MAILDGDIQLLKSEVMDDVDEGGGMATSSAVVDGVSNNMFADISELDRTYGRISLRKVFPAVVTDNTDSYYGAHVIVATPPADPKVSVSLFSTRNWFDQRTAMQNKLEGYISASAEGRWMLFGNHLSGQRALQMHCLSSAPTPGVDDVLMLQNAGKPSEYQYVRVSRIVSRESDVQFDDIRGTFYRDIITVELSDALRYSFTAAAMERWTNDWFAPPTRVHTTLAADAASYFGVKPLKIAAALGALTVKVPSIYTQLVPSALAETPIVDARCVGDRSFIVPIPGADATTGNAYVNLSTAGAVSNIYVGHPIAPGTVTVSPAGVSLSDDGHGNIPAMSGYSGSVDYDTGTITLTTSTPGASGSVPFSAGVAASISAAGRSTATEITINNRGYTYVKALSPAPAPGSVEVSYRAQDKWYTLTDNGSGNLVGESGTGGGNVDYATGGVVVTLGALPDADTSIVYSWGSSENLQAHVGTSVFTTPAIDFTLPGGAITPGSLTIKYLAGAALRTVTDNSAGGLSGGFGTGYVDYANGKISLRPSLLPDAGSSLDVTYSQGLTTSEVIAATGAVNNFTLDYAVKPGTLSIAVSDTMGNNYLIGDDGAGVLVLRSVQTVATGSSAGGGNIGVYNYSGVSVTSTAGIGGGINYATGEVNLGLSAQVTSTSGTMSGLFYSSNTTSSTTTTEVAEGNINVSYRQAGDTDGGVQTDNIPLEPLVFDLLPTVANSLVPGSLYFKFGGSRYVDRNGTIVRDPSFTNNAGTPAGTVNYLTGRVTLTSYQGGLSNAAATVYALTRLGAWVDYQVSFRTAGAPLQQSSLYVSAVRADNSALLSASADSAGDLNATYVDGHVDTSTGVATVRFGNMVTAAGNEGEWWYDAANVVAGQIFKPVLILPETAKYNAVATSSLPLSAEILGLDPVRLPADGRVPIYRPGDVVVVHNTQTTTPATVSNGQTVDCGRVRLAKVRVIGNNGATITSGYTHDLDAGTVTFSNVTGYSQPVKVEHRIEDMALVSDVQINGDLRLTRSLTHDFPLGSFVSSALIIGDLKARVSVFFDQQTWNGWYDTLQGSNATGTYNKAQYPVEVSNRGCIQERWNIVFTNTTTVNVVGENVGQILSGVSITADIAPINPATGTPYFTLKALGWGAGWSAGNVLRFNTTAANYPVSVARTVLQGNPTVSNDSFALGIRGDIDA